MDTTKGCAVRERYLRTYGHLFPHLFDPSQLASLEPCSSATIESAARGWESQLLEFDEYELEVEGTIPSELQGTLLRNGPGLLEVYGTPLVHPIDGDGMVCAIRIKDGRAFFRSRYVKTTGYVTEKNAGKAVFPGMMGTKPPGYDDLPPAKRLKFKNPSNTNAYFWGGKILSCWESGWPYALDPVTLDTIGKESLNGALDECKCVAAHFRYDAARDVLVTFSLKLTAGGGSIMMLHEFGRNWGLVSQQRHELDKFYYCHDLLITDNFYIIHHTPFYTFNEENVMAMMAGSTSPGECVHIYPGAPSAFLLIPRDVSQRHAIRHFDTQPCHIYHHLNAYEEGHKIFFASVCLGERFNMSFDRGVWLSNTTVAPGQVFQYEIDLSANTIRRWRGDACSCEFPTVNYLLSGRKYRYAYLMAAEAGKPYIPYQEVIKWDATGQTRQVWSSRDEGGVIGEPIFVPRQGGVEEDDGWVITQMYNARTHKTENIIFDARHVDAGPIARLKLAHHTPYGFHGTFTHELF